MVKYMNGWLIECNTLNMFLFKFKREKINVRVVSKRSVYVPIRKPFVFKGVFLSIFAGIIFSGLFSYGVYVFANPPTSPYAPGATLNPLCTPGSVNCTVSPPLYISDSTLDIFPNNFIGGNPLRIKYNSTNYATLTVGTNGDLTISTNSSGGGGNINFNSPTSSNATILSNSGILTLGGTLSGDENLNFDFHDYQDKVVVTSGTGVNTLDFGSMNLSTTGLLTLGGSTTGTLVTRVSSGAPTESDTNGSLVIDNTAGRLYFRYGNAWHYIAQTGGFQIPNFETVDPISGELIQEGDFVVGVIDKSFEDNALHGVWVRWDTLKQQLIDEIASTGGLSVSSTSTVSGEKTQLTTDSTNQSSQSTLSDSLLGRVKNVLSIIGITIKDGITNIKNLAVENFQAKTAKIEKLELVDSATGEPYCTWIENGILKSEKGECGSIQVAVNNSNSNQQSKQIIQDTADKAAQTAVDKLDKVIQEKVAEEVQNKLGGQPDNSSEGETDVEETDQGNEEAALSPASENASDTGKENSANANENATSNNGSAQGADEGSTNEKNNGNVGGNGNQGNSENNPKTASAIDILIENSTSALFDRMNLFVKSLTENTKNLSAGFMEPLKYLIDHLFLGNKENISNSSKSFSIASLYESFSKNSFNEYLWIYSPSGILIEAKSEFLNLSKKISCIATSCEK